MRSGSSQVRRTRWHSSGDGWQGRSPRRTRRRTGHLVGCKGRWNHAIRGKIRACGSGCPSAGRAAGLPAGNWESAQRLSAVRLNSMPVGTIFPAGRTLPRSLCGDLRAVVAQGGADGYAADSGPVRAGELVELAAALGDGRHTYTLTAQTSGIAADVAATSRCSRLSRRIRR